MKLSNKDCIRKKFEKPWYKVWLSVIGINHRSLFNAKSSLYIYIKYIWFGLVGFYGISTIVGYLMPNSLYTYILLMLHSHDTTICIHIHAETKINNNDERMVVWEVNWRLNRLQDIDSQFLWLLQHFFLILLGCSTMGSWGPKPSAVSWFSLPRTATQTNWLQLTRTVCGIGLYHCLTSTCFPWASQMHRFQPVHMSRWYLWHLRPDAPVSRLTAGLKDNMLHLYRVWFCWVLWNINHWRLLNIKSYLHISTAYIRTDWVFWHINHCILFNAKSSLYLHTHTYIYIYSIWFVCFYGISNIVGYLITNPIYTYIY